MTFDSICGQTVGPFDPLTAEQTNYHTIQTKNETALPIDSGDQFEGIVTLEQSDFDEFIQCMTTPKQPTEAIRKGTQLLKLLRGQSL